MGKNIIASAWVINDQLEVRRDNTSQYKFIGEQEVENMFYCWPRGNS
jgi:hypothetical protein